VIASCVVSVVSNGHEIAQLRREPVVERLRMSSDKVAADEDVEDSGYKCNLLSDRHNFGIVPTPAESIHRLLHALCVPVQLLIWCWYSSPPFLNHSVLCILARRSQLFALAPDPLRVCRQSILPLLEPLWQC